MTVKQPLQHASCAAGEKFVVVTLKMMFLLSFLAIFGFSSISQDTSEDPSSGFGFKPNYGNFVIFFSDFFLYGDGF